MLLASFIAILCKWSGLNFEDFGNRPFFANLFWESAERKPPDKVKTEGMAKKEKKKMKSEQMKPMKQKVQTLMKFQKLEAKMKQMKEEERQMDVKAEQKHLKFNDVFGSGLMAAFNVVLCPPMFTTPQQHKLVASIVFGHIQEPRG